ncbi:chemotaxis protein CheB [Oleiharenicola lentus]|uniref:chemotaxis protein CheB n=1 Tax=Oleiharenicola lentus TaxID=2508720 RepID=UPI003F67AB5A
MTAAAQQSKASPEPAECVVIGGSAGAIDALMKILPALPRGYPLPVLVVVHLQPTERSLLSEIFSQRCALPVKEAEDKEPIIAGTIYFAPPDYHLLVEADHTLSLSSDEPIYFSRPAIDVLFESAADAYGSALRAVILTGASSDGAAGLRTVQRLGGLGFVQRPDTAEATMMPQSALDACPSAQSLKLPQIASVLAVLPGTLSLS